MRHMRIAIAAAVGLAVLEAASANHSTSESARIDRAMTYIREHNVPYNALHDRGYPSIGCAPCTRAIQPGEDQRAGRWWWEHPDTKECGLHVAPQPKGKQ